VPIQRGETDRQLQMKELVRVSVEGKGTMLGKRQGIQMKSRIRGKGKTIRNRMEEKSKKEKLKESC